MKRERKSISGPEKLAIRRRYRVEKVAISDLCYRYGLQPSQVDNWQTQLFEHGASVLERQPGRKAHAHQPLLSAEQRQTGTLARHAQERALSAGGAGHARRSTARGGFVRGTLLMTCACTARSATSRRPIRWPGWQE